MIGALLEEWGGYLAVFFIGCVLAGGAAYKYEAARFDKYVAEVAAVAAVAEAEAKSKELDLAKRNEAIKASYDARIAGLNARISGLRLAADGGSISKDTAAHSGFNATATDLISNPVALVEACSLTTAQVVELQEYVKHVLAVYNR